MSTTRGYHDVHLKTDALSLKHVLEQFRKIRPLTNYKLDPCHFCNSLELSQDTMLKMTGSVLELFTDIDIVQFTKKDMRDEIS